MQKSNSDYQGLRIWVLVGILILSCTCLAHGSDDSEEKSKNSEEEATSTTPATVMKDWRIIAPNLKIGGSLRGRVEVKNNFNFAETKQDYALSQLRLNLSWQPKQFLKIFIEGQDARVFGETLTDAPGVNENAVPNIFADRFDLHQGYVDAAFKLQSTDIKIRAGRQKFNFGAMRLVSSLEWVNTARVWDGVRATIGNPKREIDIFASRLVPVRPGTFNDHANTGSRYFNSGLHGAYYKDQKLVRDVKLEAYWLLREESAVDDAVHTLGLRFESKKGNLDFSGEFAGQTGRYGGLDHQAFLLHLQSGIKLPDLAKTRVLAAYNYATGDNDPNDDKHQTVDNLYPLNHAYYGYMDFFALQNIHNFELTAMTKLLNKVGVRVSYQNFWLANPESDAWYNAGLRPVRAAAGTSVDSHIASEIDITANYALRQGRFVLVGGYSRLFTGSYIESTGNSNNADFWFLMNKIQL